MNDKFMKERVRKAIISYAKTHGQWTLKEISYEIKASEMYLRKIIKTLVSEEELYLVGAHNCESYYNIKDWYFIEPVKKKSKLMTIAPKNRPMIKITTVFDCIRANISAVDRFYRGTQCNSRV